MPPVPDTPRLGEGATGIGREQEAETMEAHTMNMEEASVDHEHDAGEFFNGETDAEYTWINLMTTDNAKIQLTRKRRNDEGRRMAALRRRAPHERPFT